MTHEAFRRRLEALEEARALRDGEPFMIHINFVCGDGSPLVPTVARTVDRSFEYLRLEGEEEAAFRCRANRECCVADPRRLQVLIFGD